MNREEHLDWSKKRALEYLPNNTDEAFHSMVNNLLQHDELANHTRIPIGFQMQLDGLMRTAEETQNWIEGFH